jgi:eukaryotic-like serine/threonine-protein kinase
MPLESVPDSSQPKRDSGPSEVLPDSTASETTVRLPNTAAAEESSGRQAALLPALAIPGYELLEEIGRGGMGVVFKARHVKLNRIVALKMILSGELASTQETARFRAEAETIAQIQHPNIIQIFEIGEHEGRLFISLEYCGGGSLESRLRGTPLPAIEAARLFATLAEALAHAHHCGVIHRDLKPANILLVSGEWSPQGQPYTTHQPKITDFGLARKVDTNLSTQTTTIVGSPSYMPPEQASGREVGPLADVYSLGASLYECLTGRPPFRASSVLETLRQVQHEEPVPPRQLQSKTPRDLETICLKCLQKDPARRYGSAAALREDLQRFLEGRAILGRPVGWPERTWRWCRRNRVVAGLLSVVAVMLVAGIVAGSIALVVINNARQEADTNAALEATARASAERAAEESRDRLIRLHIATGTRFLDAGDRTSALCWYALAWRSDRADAASEKNHRLRLASVMAAGPQLVGACFHRAPVQDAAVSPDGQHFLSWCVEGREAYLWDPTAARLAAPPLRHDGEVRCAAYSADGRLAATAGADRAACVWDAASGKRLWQLEHPAGVAWLAFRPGTSLLVTVDDGGKVYSWDLTTGQPAGSPPRSEAAVWYVAFSGDGRLLVTADRSDHARVWDAATGEAKTPPLPHLALDREEAFFHYKRWPAFNAAGTLLATATKKTLQLWDATTGDARWRNPRLLQENLAPTHLAFNHRGDRLVVSNGYVARVLRVEDGQEILGLTHPRLNQYTTFSGDDQHLVSTSSGGTVHVWNASSGEAVDLPLSCADFVRRVGFVPDSRRFFAASLDGTVRVWSLPAPRSLLTPYAYDGGRAYKHVTKSAQASETFTPDGSILAEFGPAGVEVRRRTGSDEVLFRLPRPMRWARFTADGLRLFVANTTQVECLDASTGHRLGQPIPLDNTMDRKQFAIYTARIDPSADGKRLATLDDPHTVSVWDVETGQRLLGPLSHFDKLPHIFGPPESHGRISHPRLTPDGKTLVFGVPGGGILAAWDVATGTPLYQLKRYSGNLNHLAMSEAGASILACSSDSMARLYATKTCAALGPPLVHTGSVLDGDIDADGIRAVTRQGTIARLWDAHNGDLLAQLSQVPKSVDSFWFSRDGRRVMLSGTEDAFQWRLATLEMPAEHVPALVRLLTGKDIDSANGLTQLDQHALLNDPARYRQAWVSWRGGNDDAQRQP